MNRTSRDILKSFKAYCELSNSRCVHSEDCGQDHNGECAGNCGEGNKMMSNNVMPEPPRTGAELIAIERERQMSAEGWDAQHDDAHPPLAMAIAGACYVLDLKASTVLCCTHRHEDYTINDALDLLWPWDGDWWKPTPDNPVRQLVKAGALIAAEIDRIQRSGSPPAPPPSESKKP